MKKTVCIILSLALLCAAAVAETVYLTISDGQGNLVMTYEAVEVTDVDNDGALSVYDALYAAHEAAFDGGAAAGFAAADQGYGLSITRLWGEENGGSYGYYVNDVSSYSLNDPIQDGDRVRAFVYTDLTAWSDTYCSFDTYTQLAAPGEAFGLCLTAQTYDADWNVALNPVQNAVITINGEDSAFVTGEDGVVEMHIDAPGEYLVSARSDDMLLVKPVCIVTVEEK